MTCILPWFHSARVLVSRKNVILPFGCFIQAVVPLDMYNHIFFSLNSHMPSFFKYWICVIIKTVTFGRNFQVVLSGAKIHVYCSWRYWGILCKTTLSLFAVIFMHANHILFSPTFQWCFQFQFYFKLFFKRDISNK